MRSELVFGAMTYVSNRFLLTRVAATATRKLHRPNTRIQDTANEVFGRFRHANPLPVVSCIGILVRVPGHPLRFGPGTWFTSPLR
jgi:hypothetical protein